MRKIFVPGYMYEVGRSEFMVSVGMGTTKLSTLPLNLSVLLTLAEQ